MAENDPAVATTLSSRGPSRTKSVIAIPTAEPSAISGASGPSTAPNARVQRAASATPGAYASGVGPPPMPSSGLWPPSPGRGRRARITIAAPTKGSPMTRNHGGEE